MSDVKPQIQGNLRRPLRPNSLPPAHAPPVPCCNPFLPFAPAGTAAGSVAPASADGTEEGPKVGDLGGVRSSNLREVSQDLDFDLDFGLN